MQRSKSRNHFYIFIFPFASNVAVNSRAPLEPYYGRYIGPFVEFGHKIKVSRHFENISTIPDECSFMIFSFLIYRVMYMQLTNQHYISKDLYTMALAQMHSFGLEKRIDQVQKDTLYHILKSTSAGNFHIKKLYTFQFDTYEK